MSLKIEVKSLTDLEKISENLTQLLKSNFYLILQGELGAGKTTLTQMIAKNLGIKEKITSPTFNILQQYQIKEDYYLNHFDLFRLNVNDNLEAFQELTIDNINIIEWPEKNPQFWQDKEHVFLKIVKEISGTRIVTIYFPKIKKGD
jgi:tRNA threonylcarbamoyladenosine biosynthesis protein TsaE